MSKFSPIQEVIVYTVENEQAAHFQLVDEVNQVLHSCPGFISRVVHQSINEPSKWMDLVSWNSPQAAAQGRKKYATEPLSELFSKRIQRMELRKQFSPYKTCGNPPRLPLETIVELAVYRLLPRKREQFDLVFEKMSSLLKGYPAYLYRQCGRATLEAHWFMDYFYWEKEYKFSLDSLKQAEEVQAFLALIYDVPYIDQFRILPETSSHSLGSFV